MGDRDFACCFLCIKSILLHLVMLQDTDSIPTEIAVSLSEKKIGFRLDNADLVLVPLRKYSFWKVFKAVHSKSSRLDIYDMPTVFGSVSNQINHNDSGVFVLKLLLSYDGKTHFHFKEEHAKVLRESITYYLCTHEENELILPKIKYIAQQHRIEVDNYKCRTKRISKK
ncbi:uncharacterized protein LOC120705499 isoform X5 [Panicum virgatum]|uniref:uncharacterized protein LOC120705499 isoform X5 n=1 Tax=Panicum virgatum TaxID=38727 RepID=UPI0019D63D20|nr:uncharacterized protein LOC120705499 isoform X5 [Panicum virgatum]